MVLLGEEGPISIAQNEFSMRIRGFFAQPLPQPACRVFA